MGLLRPGKTADPITVLCQIHVFYFQMNWQAWNMLMDPFPKPEFLGDYQSPTNVMVTLSSGMVRQGLGDCQAGPIMGRNG